MGIWIICGKPSASEENFLSKLFSGKIISNKELYSLRGILFCKTYIGNNLNYDYKIKKGAKTYVFTPFIKILKNFNNTQLGCSAI